MDKPLLLVITIEVTYLAGRRGHWALYYTSPQSYKKRFIISWFINFGDFYYLFDWSVYKDDCSNQYLLKVYFCVSSLRMYINLSALSYSVRSQQTWPHSHPATENYFVVVFVAPSSWWIIHMKVNIENSDLIRI